MDRYKFADFIYKKRKELNLTQDELGKKLGLTNKAVSKWETAETMPDILILIELSKIFNISIDELLLQEKKEIIYKNKFFVFPLIIFLSSMLFISLIFNSINLYNNVEDISLNLNNYEQYLNITNYKTEMTNESMYIYSMCSSNNDIIEFDLLVNYTIQCYYFDEVESLVIYKNQLLYISSFSNDYILKIEHTKQISNPNQITKIVITFEVDEVNGKVIL